MTRAASHPRPRLLAGLLLVALAGAATLLLAPAASAHGDEGVLTEVSAVPSGTSSVVTVRLTYEGDGHPVDGATVTVAGTDAAGNELSPVAMTGGAESGQYTATVDFPSGGTWTLRVTAVDPAATLEITQEITEPVVTIGGEEDAPTATADASSTTADDEPTNPAPDLTDAADEDDDSSPVLWIVGGVVAALAVVIGLVFVARGRNQGPID